MGGDRPQNRKEEGKKRKKMEGGDGDGDGKKRTADGKPVKVKGMTYQKANPSFIETMMAAHAAKLEKANQGQKGTPMDPNAGVDAMFGMIDANRAAKKSAWPSRDEDPGFYGSDAAPVEPGAKSETPKEKSKEKNAEKLVQEAAELARRRKIEQERYETGHGVQAATGQMRVIFKRKPADGAAPAESAAGESNSATVDEFGRSTEGDAKKKKKKKKKEKANTKMLSFEMDD
jgi:hypothetical protein